MTVNGIARAVKVEEKLYKGLRLFHSLREDLRKLGFWESGSYREGDEVHTFFILRNTDYTIELTQVNGVIISINRF